MYNRHKRAYTSIIPPNHQKIKKIWRITGIISVLTLLEYLCAFVMARGVLLYSIFILLTLYKAFYIIGTFMHLREEKKILIYATMLPCLLLLFLFLVLWLEAKAIMA